MRVLQINSVCGIRSTGRICTDIAGVLEANGDDCKIGYGREKILEKHEKYAVRIGGRLDELCHVAMTRVFDNTGFGSRRATKRFIKWVKAYDPDIIHLHNIHGYYIHIGVLFDYLKKAGKPVVWTLHDCWTFTGHCAYFSQINCNKWKEGGCSSCPQKRRYPASLLFDRSNKNYLKKKELFTGIDNMVIVTPSNWIADLTRQSFLGNYPVKVIHNGIDVSVFKPTQSDFRKRYNLQGKVVILGVASVWGERKGFGDMIKLAELLSENERIVLVGLNEKQASALPKNIIGITRTNNAGELAQIYTAADVFVNPTYEDNYPTVNLEAQSCGTPVVTYRTGGSIESVPLGNVVEQGDVSGLLEKIREIVEAPFGQLHDITEFASDYHYAEYCDLYRNGWSGMRKQRELLVED